MPTVILKPMRLRLSDIRKNYKERLLFHRNYFKIIITTAVVLLTISPTNFGNTFCLPILYVLVGYFWITVTTHYPSFLTLNNQPYPNGWTHSSLLCSFLFPVEGNHNTYHIRPDKIDTYGIDISVYIIRNFLSKTNLKVNSRIPFDIVNTMLNISTRLRNHLSHFFSPTFARLYKDINNVPRQQKLVQSDSKMFNSQGPATLYNYRGT